MKFGLDNLELASSSDWGRVGLLSNQASVSSDRIPGWKVLSAKLGKNLTVLFGPQHGFVSVEQYNMDETSHQIHKETGLPVFSLYSETRRPTVEMLDYLDTLVLDLQTTGCRIYTWKATLRECLEACHQNNKRIVVLDRPNPIGGVHVEGATLQDEWYSFVGAFKAPLRYGLTFGEVAKLLNKEIGAELEVVKMTGWDPNQIWSEIGKPWILTSPMLPTLDSLYMYPGMVLLEGTNLSEGRGTTLPFQMIGAPYIDAKHLKNAIVSILGHEPPGVWMREASFSPTWNKWQGEICHGIHFHVEDPKVVRSVDLTLALIRACSELFPKDFAFIKPGYEYDYERAPINLLWGDEADSAFLAKSFSLEDSFWQKGKETYIKNASSLLIYPRQLK